MGLFSPHLGKIATHVDPIAGVLTRNDPIFKGANDWLTKKVTPSPLAPPTADTAANAAMQTQQDLLRRRGILGNVYAGGNTGGSAPTTQSKSVLGT